MIQKCSWTLYIFAHILHLRVGSAQISGKCTVVSDLWPEMPFIRPMVKGRHKIWSFCQIISEMQKKVKKHDIYLTTSRNALKKGSLQSTVRLTKRIWASASILFLRSNDQMLKRCFLPESVALSYKVVSGIAPLVLHRIVTNHSCQYCSPFKANT